MNRRWTPVELEVLLKIYYSAEPRNGILHGQSYTDAVVMWHRQGCIKPSDDRPTADPMDRFFVTRFDTTPRGAAMVEALCHTQLPEMKA